MVLQRPDFYQFEEPGGTPGHYLLQVGSFHLAGLAGAVLGVGRAFEAGNCLEVRLVLAGGVALGVAGARARDNRRVGVVRLSCRPPRPAVRGSGNPFYYVR